MRRRPTAREVARDLASGLTVESLSERYSLPCEAIRELGITGLPPLTHSVSQDSRLQIQRHLADLNQLVEDYQQVADYAPNEELRLKALDRKHRAMITRVEYLMAVGLVPTGWQYWKHERDLRRHVKLVVDWLGEQGIPARAQSELLERITAPRISDPEWLE